MAILSRNQADILNYPKKKWILNKILFNTDSWNLQESMEYLKTYLPGQEVPSYICISKDSEFEPSYWINFRLCFDVVGSTVKNRKLRNGIELVFQYVA